MCPFILFVSTYTLRSLLKYKMNLYNLPQFHNTTYYLLMGEKFY